MILLSDLFPKVNPQIVCGNQVYADPITLGKPEKKFMAGPLREGGGVRGRPFYFYLITYNKNNILLNKMTYRNIHIQVNILNFVFNKKKLLFASSLAVLLKGPNLKFLVTHLVPIHKTLPRSSAVVNWISVRFYETGCIVEFIFGA